MFLLAANGVDDSLRSVETVGALEPSFIIRSPSAPPVITTLSAVARIFLHYQKRILILRSDTIAQPAPERCSSRVWVLPTSILQSKIRVCGAQRSNESPSGAFKRQNGLRQQMEGPRPDKFADVYTSALLADAMKSLNMLSKVWKSFCKSDRPFSSFTWCGRLFFLLRKFSSLQSQQAGRVGTNSQFLNQIFQIRLQKYLLGFSQTRHSAQNCAECASYPPKALWPTRGLVPSSSLFFRQSFPCFFLQAAESNVLSKLFVDTARFLW